MFFKSIEARKRRKAFLQLFRIYQKCVSLSSPHSGMTCIDCPYMHRGFAVPSEYQCYEKLIRELYAKLVDVMEMVTHE